MHVNTHIIPYTHPTAQHTYHTTYTLHSHTRYTHHIHIDTTHTNTSPPKHHRHRTHYTHTLNIPTPHTDTPNTTHTCYTHHTHKHHIHSTPHTVSFSLKFLESFLTSDPLLAVSLAWTLDPPLCPSPSSHILCHCPSVPSSPCPPRQPHQV